MVFTKSISPLGSFSFSYDPAILLLDIYWKNSKTLIQEDTSIHPFVHCSTIGSAQDRSSTCPDTYSLSLTTGRGNSTGFWCRWWRGKGARSEGNVGFSALLQPACLYAPHFLEGLQGPAPSSLSYQTDPSPPSWCPCLVTEGPRGRWWGSWTSPPDPTPTPGAFGSA